MINTKETHRTSDFSCSSHTSLHFTRALALSLNPPISWAPKLSADINAIVPEKETGL